jgi:flagellar basal body-associated protein FliL
MDQQSKKNKPNLLIIVLLSLIPLTVLVYFILQMVFPSLFQSMPNGEIQPVQPDR